MRFLIKTVMLLALAGGVFLVGYAFLADLSPNQTDVVLPVELDVD